MRSVVIFVMSNNRIVRRKSPRLSVLLSTFTIVLAWVAWTFLAKKREFSPEEDEATTESEEEKSIKRDERYDDFAKNYNGGTIDEDRSTVARYYGLLNDIDSRIGRILLRVFGKNETIDNDAINS